MNSQSLGDLAQSFMMQRRGVALRAEMARLSEELASGQVSEVKALLAGNYSYLSDIERDLKTAEGFRISASEAGQYADAIQLALEKVQTASVDLGASLITVSANPSDAVLELGSQAARSALEAIFASLNTSVAGRQLFSGTTTQTAPLNDVDTLLNTLQTVIGGLTRADDIRTAAETWFADPLGFRATVYQGSDDPLAPFQVTRDEAVTVDVRADGTSFHGSLMNAALAVLSSRDGLGLTIATQADLQREAGVALVADQQNIVGLRGQIGTAQERIENLTARIAAERTSLEYARGDLLGADPFETATRLEDVQFRLQSLYTVTGRTAGLSLVNFLR